MPGSELPELEEEDLRAHARALFREKRDLEEGARLVGLVDLVRRDVELVDLGVECNVSRLRRTTRCTAIAGWYCMQQAPSGYAICRQVVPTEPARSA